MQVTPAAVRLLPDGERAQTATPPSTDGHSPRQPGALVHPMQQGVVQDWDAMETLLHYVLYDEVGTPVAACNGRYTHCLQHVAWSVGWHSRGAWTGRKAPSSCRCVWWAAVSCIACSKGMLRTLQQCGGQRSQQ
jgi:hypothetical protein